jgi:hypothetical protein
MQTILELPSGHLIHVGCAVDPSLRGTYAWPISAQSTSWTLRAPTLALMFFHLGMTISREISLPITPEDRHKYTVTQLLADIIRRQGYDGIRFSSSVAPGSNVCIFQPGLFASEANSGKVLYVKSLKYKMEKLAHLIDPTDDDVPLQ